MKEWVSFNWYTSFSSTDRDKLFNLIMLELELNTSIKWPNGDNPRSQKYVDAILSNNTHLLFKKTEGYLGYTADPMTLADADPVVNLIDFMDEINAGLAALPPIPISRVLVPGPPNPQTDSKYDTVCYHCGAPARTLFFNVECSKGCQC